MNKLFLLTLLFSSISYADLDIGEDFEAGDLVSAEEFNNKFGKLKKVVGEIKDQELLGSWDCTKYTLNQANNNGYFELKTGKLIFSELDSDSSLTSPKNWLIDSDDVLHGDNHVEGLYTLLLNKLHLFVDSSLLEDDSHPSGIVGTYAITMIDDLRMLLDNGDVIYPGEIPFPNILCEKRS